MAKQSDLSGQRQESLFLLIGIYVTGLITGHEVTSTAMSLAVVRVLHGALSRLLSGG